METRQEPESARTELPPVNQVTPCPATESPEFTAGDALGGAVALLDFVQSFACLLSLF